MNNNKKVDKITKILKTIYEKDYCTVNEVHNYTGIALTTLYSIIKNLIAQNLIQKVDGKITFSLPIKFLIKILKKHKKALYSEIVNKEFINKNEIDNAISLFEYAKIIHLSSENMKIYINIFNEQTLNF